MALNFNNQDKPKLKSKTHAGVKYAPKPTSTGPNPGSGPGQNPKSSALREQHQRRK
jgi:hypothetical protein